MIERKTLWGDKNTHILKQQHADVFEGQPSDPQSRNFHEMYDKLSLNTKFKKELAQTETIVPEQKHNSNTAFARKLRDKNRRIIGICQKFNENMHFINVIGRTHLQGNEFTNKRTYNELDVYAFN